MTDPAPPMPEGLDAVLVTPEMESAGMKEWDRQHKAGERMWPTMLAAVYRAMLAAAPPLASATATADLERRLAEATGRLEGKQVVITDLESRLAAPTERNAALEAALNLAIIGLYQYEPNDARGMSDAFVAISAVAAGDISPQVMDCVKSETERYAALSPPSQRSSGEVQT